MVEWTNTPVCKTGGRTAFDGSNPSLGTMLYFTYILYSPSHDKYYIGSTSNLKKRVKRHNSGKSKYTKPFKPWILVYHEKFETRSEAIQREKYLKSLKDKTLIKKLVDKYIPV